jgi:serine-type D-Ala-D-Ala carboxypeptidase (penicillin-binding protein 5/6)
MAGWRQQRSLGAWCLVACAAAAVVTLLLAAPGPTPTAGAAAPRQTPSAAPTVRARSGILISRSTGDVLWSKSPGLRLPPASCTKIMTALLTLEHFKDLSHFLRAPASVASQQKVAIGLHPGDRITVRQALRGMLIKSANDATITLAVGVAGSERAFVKLMNRRAGQLGLTGTHFMNSRGKDQKGHYMCARDLATLGRYVWKKYAYFRRTVATKTAVVTWPPSHRVTVTSHNRLLDYEWGDGIKTGATTKAGKVLVGSGTPSGVPLIVVTMREPTRDQEEADAVALLQWGAAQ